MRIFQTVLLKTASVFLISVLLNSSCSNVKKNNVANENPLVIEKMEEIMLKEHLPSKHFKLTSLDSLMI